MARSMPPQYRCRRPRCPTVEDLGNSRAEPAGLERLHRHPGAAAGVSDLLDKAPSPPSGTTLRLPPHPTLLLPRDVPPAPVAEERPAERIHDMRPAPMIRRTRSVAAKARLGPLGRGSRPSSATARRREGRRGSRGVLPGGRAGATTARCAAQERPGPSSPRCFLPEVRLAAGHRHADQGQPTVGSDPATQRQDPNVLPSLLLIRSACSCAGAGFRRRPSAGTIRRICWFVRTAGACWLFLLYVTWPGIRKAGVRKPAPKRGAGRRAAARIALT